MGPPLHDIVVVLFLAEFICSLVTGDQNVCHIGSRSSNGHKWSYTLTPSDPCTCTRLIATGRNGDELVLDDITIIRNNLGLTNCADLQKPVLINMPANVVQSTDHGVATAMVNWTAPSATDNSGSPAITSTHSPGQLFPIGDTVVSYTAIDSSGNIASDMFTVTVQDNERPVIIQFPANMLQNTDHGVALATVNWIAPSATDNSGFAPTLTSTHSPGAIFNIGDTVVSYTAIDPSGNVARDVFTVTVQDNESPVIIQLPANILQNTDHGVATATVNWIAPSASDNSGSAPTLTSTHSPGESFPIGVTLISYTAIDLSGNKATGNVTATVEDIEAPVINNMPASITQDNDDGAETATIKWVPPTASDNSGTVTLTSSHDPGSLFAIGIQTVIYTARDHSGNTVIDTFNVTVQVACRYPLGMEDGRIRDGKITASSVFFPSLDARFARLNKPRSQLGGGSWSAATNDIDQWIQVDLGIPRSISAILLQGRNHTYEQWVTEYTVTYSAHGAWGSVKDVGHLNDMVFQGNSDSDTIVTSLLPYLIWANVVRIHPTKWHRHISLRFEILGCKVSCRHPYPLGLEDGRIHDNQITSSPSPHIYILPEHARLNRPDGYVDPLTGRISYGGWCALGNDADMWIQVDLGLSVLVAGIVMQGRTRSVYEYWVTAYKIQYSIDGALWKFLMDITQQNEMEFDGPSTGNSTTVTSMFHVPVHTRFIRIRPTAWHSHPCLRLEILGCKGFCMDPLGMKDGGIKDNMISASSSHFDAQYTATSARLDGTTCWAANTSSANQWIQVDFGVSKYVSGVVIQGQFDADSWVTKYKVGYNIQGSNNPSVHYVQDTRHQTVVVFPGSFDRNTPVTSLFPSSVIATLIRIYPTEWERHVSMRFELLGCRAVCEDQLGMKDGRIADSQISASSEWGFNSASKLARLGHVSGSHVYGPYVSGGWSALTSDNHQWIQVNFDVSTSVSGIVTQGRNDFTPQQFVSKYMVQYRNGHLPCQYVKDIDEGKDMVFIGNYDGDTAVTNLFAHTVTATYVRIKPTEWTNYISMRFEVLGCDCIGHNPLGMADHVITDGQITASSEVNADWSASQARLGNTRGWVSSTVDQHQWIKVVLNDVYTVNSIMSQGCIDAWVTDYTVEYSKDDVLWMYIVEDYGWPKVFAANTDATSAITNIFPQPVPAYAIRIRPTAWKHAFNLRFELLACKPSSVSGQAFYY